ncbi:MAG: SAM-dependent methyltransferase [Sphingobacteriaceae bacterium]|nr:SAM-dependent methyltransferase [Sphingobacteriaceae bacterium]
MSNSEKLQLFKSDLVNSINDKKIVKISLGNYQGNDKELKNIHVRPVIIKRKPMFSFTYKYKTRDIVKNHVADAAIELVINNLSNDFRIGTLFTVEHESVLEQAKNGEFSFRKTVNKVNKEVKLSHDKEKKRIIKPNLNSYLTDLNITDNEGKVFKSAQDKFKQINQYIEIVSSLIKDLPKDSIENVVDMGSGKGYLTFALYDYLKNFLKVNAKVTGVEFRKDMVDLCNQIATKNNFNQLGFVEGTIENYTTDKIDLLIALHACDTATDDAIFKGISANAQLIVVAPCCHKQIRREMEKSKVENDISFLTKHGIFLERQAEMVTDGIRALILEYFGYKTKVFEFISDAHTPKNVLVVGIKRRNANDNQSQILEKIKEAKSFFGITQHHLEKLTDL